MEIFSPNEQMDDINTEDLKYLLVPFYLGMLYPRMKGDSRLKKVKQAIVSEKYLNFS